MSSDPDDNIVIDNSYSVIGFRGSWGQVCSLLLNNVMKLTRENHIFDHQPVNVRLKVVHTLVGVDQSLRSWQS